MMISRIHWDMIKGSVIVCWDMAMGFECEASYVIFEWAKRKSCYGCRIYMWHTSWNTSIDIKNYFWNSLKFVWIFLKVISNGEPFYGKIEKNKKSQFGLFIIFGVNSKNKKKMIETRARRKIYSIRSQWT